MGSAGSSEICKISCAARRLSILRLPWKAFRKRVVKDSVAEVKERSCVPGGREMEEEQSRELHTSLWNKEERVKVRDSNAGSQHPKQLAAYFLVGL